MTNIALVVLDTLRKDFFDYYFDWLPGIRFENAWSPSNYTVPVHASMFTGKYASEIGVHSKSERFDCGGPVLAESLQDAGFRTHAISANLLLSPTNDFDRGFDDFSLISRAAILAEDTNMFDWQSVTADTEEGLLRDLRLLARCVYSSCDTIASLRYGLRLKLDRFFGAAEAESLIESLDVDDDEFLFVNLMDAHAPYVPPPKYRSVEYEPLPIEKGLVVDEDVDFESRKQAYEDCVRYLSDKYRDIFDQLTDRFDVIITVSDHGELFGEYGTSHHYYGVFPELTHVPLTIYTGEDGRESRDETVSLLDIHQTILAASDVPAESRGQNLLADVTSREYLTEYHGIRTSQKRRLVDKGFAQETLDQYDQSLHGITLPSNYYGFETLDGFREQGETTCTNPYKRMEALLDELDCRDDYDSRAVEQTFSEQTRRQLEELGYL